ncbi:MAG TPA: GNAT family N-acetyltransferase [Roseiarcus sp.]|jgi:GNAT superfamily N-acetyltransferase|nr:GNAT family N-acetyltransferase [Roseiarcus sp.]
MEIQRARISDAEEACAVHRRSIIELCAADHRNDPAILAAWLANKTPENFRAWIERSDNSLFVAIEAGAIIAVGCVTDAGEITLNYVSPDARFRGVSKAMLAQLEAKARERGANACTLLSTETARRFYLSAGYIEQGRAAGRFGAGSAYPMMKSLVAEPKPD